MNQSEASLENYSGTVGQFYLSHDLQLLTSLTTLGIGCALAERVGQGEVVGVTLMQCDGAWVCLCLAAESLHLALAWPFCPFLGLENNALRNDLFPMI